MNLAAQSDPMARVALAVDLALRDAVIGYIEEQIEADPDVTLKDVLAVANRERDDVEGRLEALPPQKRRRRR